MKRLSLFFIFSLIFLICTFTNCATVDENIWFTRDATSCAEAWYNEDWLSPQEEENAKTWLEMQGVTVLASEYDPAGTTPEACNACSCLSGGVYRVQVDAVFTDIMLSEGFELE